MENYQLKAIGVLHTPYSQRFGTPRQGHLVPAALGYIEFYRQLQPEEMLAGLAGFSHIWLISLFHENLAQKFPPKVHPPRLGGTSVGVLASRSPHRPNPIGLTLAKIEKVEPPRLWVSGLDLIDGTPILDVKPYVTESDQVDAKTVREGWVKENPWVETQVLFTPEFQQEFAACFARAPLSISSEQTLTLLEQTLRHDPRAVSDRQFTLASRGQRPYWLRLYNYDFGFSITENCVQVLTVRLALEAPETKSLEN